MEERDQAMQLMGLGDNNQEKIYDNDEFDQQGFNKNGFGRNHRTKEGNLFDKEGFDFRGIDKEGFNQKGFNINTKLHRNGTPYDENGLDRFGKPQKI